MLPLRVVCLAGVALAFGPPPPPQHPTDGCALIIPGAGRSSAFDHAASAFGGHGSPYNGGQTCITFEAVNAAFLSARDRVGLKPVNDGKFKADEVGALGTVIHEASRFLAKQYGLTKDAVANGLPLIDTTRTAIEPYCPPFLMTPECEVARYRSITGACNNLENPHWGAAMNGHERFINPDYADGISAPRANSQGAPLPSARTVSSSVHQDKGFHDHAVTIMLIAWGQFIDHDITLTSETKDPNTGKTPKCCDDGPGAKHPNCLPIEIPHNDHFYKAHKQRCMNFVRSQSGLRLNCRLGPRNSFNQISSLLDAGTVYSNDDEVQEELRAFKGGQLKMLPVFETEGMKPLLPLKLHEPDEGCIRPSEDVYCFLAGDPRVNEQTVLAITHTLFVRQHNLIAKELAHINPHWNDETLFQETRHIVIAMIQHITYNEFLPMVLGKEVMTRHNLILGKSGYFEGYDPYTDPSAATGFTSDLNVIQRGREHGIPSYNAWREWCGFPKIYRFSDLEGIMSNTTVAGYSKYYASPDDIDLWSAGISERPLPGSMVGPTFACIIGKQFHNFRLGDRFWYENGGWPSSFTLEQLAEIRKTKLSRVLCDCSDDIDNIQVYAMVLPDHEINPRVPCKNGVLPKIDLTKWRDASYHSSPYQEPFHGK